MGLTNLTTFALTNCRTAIVALVVSTMTVSAWTHSANAVDFPSEQLEYFEKYVRPVLVQRCHSCHDSNKQEGGLRLDSRQLAIKGGDRGQAMILGNPNGSLLIKAITYEDDDLAMPPDGKLPPLEIEHLVKWIAMGAAWPAPSESARTLENGEPDPRAEIPAPDYEQHWAFQPVRQVEVPETEAPGWPVNAIDAFVLQRLESAHLAPAEDAEPRIMVRRLYLDLIGLPPSFEEVEQFVQSIADSQTPVDYGALIEDLLSRREYGERWARHWLDVARYADTKGYVDGGQREFAFAYTYRDYVIRAFNEDLPFDQFIVDQLAADQIPYSSAERWRMAAMGFLTVGRRFNHNPYDILDDQIDVISRGLQAMTVSCARCHDHKYDPIPTADYYSLYGVLSSSHEPLQPDSPILTDEPVAVEYSEYKRELTKRAVAFNEQFNQLHRQIERELREMATDYLVYIVKESSRHRGNGQNPLRTERVFLRGPSAYAAGAIRRWRNYVYSCDTHDEVFGLWHRMDPFGQEEFAEQLPRQINSTNVHPLVKAAVMSHKPSSMVELAQCYGQVLEQTAQAWEQHLEKFPAAKRFEDAERESIRQVLYGTGSPAVMSAQESIDCYHLDDSTSIRNKAGEIEKLTLEYKGELPDRAMMLREGDLYQPIVFLRGEHTRPGPAVPRKLPQVFLGNSASEPFDDRSGRLDLAWQLASADNRLTAQSDRESRLGLAFWATTCLDS